MYFLSKKHNPNTINCTLLVNKHQSIMNWKPKMVGGKKRKKGLEINDLLLSISL